MKPFTMDNTAGYTEAQLAELNERFALACASHLAESIYEDAAGILDIEAWASDDPDDYQALMERVLREYDSATRQPGAHTLSLVKTPLQFLIQETDSAGRLVDLYYLSGESARGSTLTWAWLCDIGTQAEDTEDYDSDDFWEAVDEAIRWIRLHYGPRVAWAQCQDAYAGVLNAHELAEHFRSLAPEKGAHHAL